LLRGKIENTSINCLKSGDMAKSMDKDGRDQEEQLLSGIVQERVLSKDSSLRTQRDGEVRVWKKRKK